MTNKYAKQNIEEKKSIRFSWKWSGNRTPEFIIFPSGKKVKIEHMRNGVIIFDDGSCGNYQRTLDDNKTQERVVIIELEVN